MCACEVQYSLEDDTIIVVWYSLVPYIPHIPHNRYSRDGTHVHNFSRSIKINDLLSTCVM